MLHLGRLEYVLRDLELHVSDINPKQGRDFMFWK